MGVPSQVRYYLAEEQRNHTAAEGLSPLWRNAGHRFTVRRAVKPMREVMCKRKGKRG